MSKDNLKAFREILIGLDYKAFKRHLNIYFEKSISFYTYKGTFNLTSNKLEVETKCNAPELNSTKYFLFNLAREEEKLITSIFIKHLLDLS